MFYFNFKVFLWRYLCTLYLYFLLPLPKKAQIKLLDFFIILYYWELQYFNYNTTFWEYIFLYRWIIDLKNTFFIDFYILIGVYYQFFNFIQLNFYKKSLIILEKKEFLKYFFNENIITPILNLGNFFLNSRGFLFFKKHTQFLKFLFIKFINLILVITLYDFIKTTVLALFLGSVFFFYFITIFQIQLVKQLSF